MRILLILALSCQFCFAQNWQPLGSGLDYFTTAMYDDSLSNRLLINGWFTMADSVVVNGMTFYDSTFHTMPPGLNTSCPSGGGGDVRTMQRYGPWIYFGGNFSCVSGMNNTSSLARWNGSIWDSVPGGGIPFQNGVVNDMAIYNNELYICGTFHSVSGVTAHQIAKFNGSTWTAVGNNYFFNYALNRIIFYHGNMYVAGNINDPQGNLCRLAMWNGNNWTYLNQPAGGLAGVWDMEVYNDELYVCGEFYFNDGNPGTSIMRWNDTTWRDVGGSVQEYASAWSVMKKMQVHNGKLYCVGGFQMVGNVEARGLASWDGNQWCGYETYFGASQPFQFVGPDHIAFHRDTMYVAGNFMYIDSLQVNFIAKWVGGNFVDTCGTAVGISESTPVQTSVLVYPNPSSSITTFQFASSAQRTIIVTDNLGREIWSKQTSEPTVEFAAQEYAIGMYFYTVVEGDNNSASGKLIIQH